MTPLVPDPVTVRLHGRNVRAHYERLMAEFALLAYVDDPGEARNAYLGALEALVGLRRALNASAIALELDLDAAAEPGTDLSSLIPLIITIEEDQTIHA